MTSILELVEGLVRDPQAKADYNADPGAYLQRHGLGDLEDDDITEALGQVSDSFPPRLAAQVDPAAGLEPLAEVALDDLGLADVDDFSAGPFVADDGQPPEPSLDGEPAAPAEPFGPDGDLDDGASFASAQAATGATPLGADVELDRADRTGGEPASDDALGRRPDNATALSADDQPATPVEPSPDGSGDASRAAPMDESMDAAPLATADAPAEPGDPFRGVDGVDGVDPAGAGNGLDDAGHGSDGAEGPWSPTESDFDDVMTQYYEDAGTPELDDL